MYYLDNIPCHSCLETLPSLDQGLLNLWAEKDLNCHMVELLGVCPTEIFMMVIWPLVEQASQARKCSLVHSFTHLVKTYYLSAVCPSPPLPAPKKQECDSHDHLGDYSLTGQNVRDSMDLSGPPIRCGR